MGLYHGKTKIQGETKGASEASKAALGGQSGGEAPSKSERSELSAAGLA